MKTRRNLWLVVGVALVLAASGTARADDWYVRPDGSNTNTGKGKTASQAFKTIQWAVDKASSGDRIFVAPGTYVEQVTIRNKSLRLFGGVPMPGITAGRTIVQMPFVRTADPTKKLTNTLVPLNNSANQADPTIWVEDTSPNVADVAVDLVNFTVDGANLGKTAKGPVFSGIVYRACRGNILDCVVRNYQDNPPSGVQRGVGIWIDGISAYPEATNVGIRRTVVRDVQKGLLVIKVGRAHVAECKFLGYGPVNFIAQNGIQISSGAAASVHGCEVFGFEYTGTTWASSGILVFAPVRDTHITGNFLSGCDVGIFIESADDWGPKQPIGPGIVAGNTISDVVFDGIYTEAPGNGRYTGNRLLAARQNAFLAEDFGPSTGPKNFWRANVFDDIVAPGVRFIPGNAGNKDPDARPEPPPFQTGANVALGSDPRGVILTDLNGDNFTDLAFVNRTSGKLLIRFGNGTGSFPTGKVLSLPGAFPVDLAAGRLNGDAKPDLAVADETGRVWITFHPFNTITTAQITGVGIQSSDQVAAIAIADVDGMKNDDILLALRGSPLVVPPVPGGGRLLTNTGNGLKYVGSNPFGTMVSSHGCVLADLDGDGDPDAVLTDAGHPTTPSTTNNVRVFKNTAGAFTTGPVLTAGKGPRRLVAADVDSNGTLDLVVANYGNPSLSEPGSVSVFENRTNGGAIVFGPAATTSAGFGTTDVAAGDLFGDGSSSPGRDVVAVNSLTSTATLLLEWRRMTLGPSSFARKLTLPGLSLPQRAALGALNVDRAADLVVANRGTSQVSRFLGNVHAALEYLGLGCRGFQGRIPTIAVRGGAPLLGNTNFALTVANARPNSLAILGASHFVATPLPQGCGLLIAPPFAAFFFTFTNGLGEATFPLAVPNVTALTGLWLYWQWGVFDADGEFFGLSLSNALRTQVGR